MVMKRLTSTGQTDVDGQPRRRLLRRRPVVRDRSEQLAPHRARRDASCARGMYGLPGGEFGWMPVATPDGRPISPVAQRRQHRLALPADRPGPAPRHRGLHGGAGQGPARGPRRDRQPPRQRRPRLARHESRRISISTPPPTSSAAHRRSFSTPPRVTDRPSSGSMKSCGSSPTGARCPSRCRTWSSATTSCQTCG